MDLKERLPAATRGPARWRCALPALAAGCTGGDDGLSVGDDPDDQVSINRGNAVEVARLVVGRGMASLSLVDLVGQGLVEPVLDPILASQFDDNVPRFECDNTQDGTVSVTLNDRDDDDLVSQNDTASLSYTNCRDLLLERTLDGATPADAAVVARLDRSPGDRVPQIPWTIGVDVELGGLTLTDPDGGAMQISGLISTSQSSNDEQLVVREANTIRFTFDDGSVVDTLRNVQTRFEEDTGAQTFSARMAGEMFSTGLDGVFTVETRTPLSGPLGQVPDRGILRVEGDGGTSMQIRAVQGGTFEAELQVDEDGDGAFDDLPAPIPVSWRELDFF